MRSRFFIAEIVSWFIFTVIRCPGFVGHVLPGKGLGLPSDFLDIALIQFEPEHIFKLTK